MGISRNFSLHNLLLGNYVQKLQDEIQAKETLLEKLQKRVNEAETKAEDLKMSIENLSGNLHLSSDVMLFPCDHLFCAPHYNIYNADSAKSEFDALEEAEKELIMIKENLNEVERVCFFYFPICSLTVFLLFLQVLQIFLYHFYLDEETL